MKQLIVSLLLFIGCTSVSATPLKHIVAADGSGEFSSISAAINACPDNERSILLIKNGRYEEQLSLGSKSKPSLKQISLIGESAEGVVITHHQARAGAGKPTFEDICTVKLYANDFYAENITIMNTATAGMAEALYVAGDRQTFKNCRIIGYQDTFRSKKGTRAWFSNCLLQGAIDFIYGGGTVCFDKCTINCVKGGGYIVAPEDRSKYIPRDSTASGKDLNLQFIFRNCVITASPDVPDESYYLGRPWNINCGTFYLNCRLGPHIRRNGWQTMNGNESTAVFGEFNSTDLNGKKSSIADRVAWSFQLAASDVKNFLQPAAVFKRMNPVPYDPEKICTAPETPFLKKSGKTLHWNRVDSAIAFLLFKDGKLIETTTDTIFINKTKLKGSYQLKAMNLYGVLSNAAVLK